MKGKPTSAQTPISPRRDAFLNAAIQVFARYGYRKTSIEQVARVAGTSRQGLYLHFPSKEELFRATVDYALSRHLDAASAALGQNRPLADRLIAACDEWAGRYVGTGTADTEDLPSASASIAKEITATYALRFEEALANEIERSAVAGTYANAGVTAQAVARTLHRAVQGIKEQSSTHQQFHDDLTVAVSVLLTPSAKRRKQLK